MRLGPALDAFDRAVSAGARAAALRRYADELEQRIAAGDDRDGELAMEARCARAAALAVEAER